mgnify:CR=1 FL=1
MKKTILYDQHISLNAKIVDFAGYKMPINYSKGINFECESVRFNSGLFDVSHMGQILIEGDDSDTFVQNLTTNDVSKLDNGQCQYSCICNESGGIIDDLIIYKMENSFLLVVNAANISKNYDWIKSRNSSKNINVTNLSDSISLIAIQGPLSRKILSNFGDFKTHVESLNFYTFSNISTKSELRIISRTGYTGELGYEIYGDHNYIKNLWKSLVQDYGVEPIGLAARDILRLEMGYRLYGNDMDEKINPLECNLGWIIDKKNDFIGKKNILKSIEKKLVLLILNDRGVPRKNYKIFHKDTEIGKVTSGTFSPNLNKGIAMGYIDIKFAKKANLTIKVRDKFLKTEIVKISFLKETSILD